MKRDNLLKLGNSVYLELAAVKAKIADKFDETQFELVDAHLSYAEAQLLEMLEEIGGKTIPAVADATVKQTGRRV